MPVWEKKKRKEKTQHSEAADNEIGRVPVFIMCYTLK